MQLNKTLFHLFISLPKSIRHENKLFYLALLSFVLPMIVSFIYVNISPEAVHIIGNDYQIKQLEQSFDPSLVNLRPEQTLGEDITMLNFYIVNNTIIGFSILFSGLLFGAGPLFLLAFQGISLGLRVGYISQLGYDETLWPFLIGHSSFELIASIIAGWCGFKIGLSLIKPGSYTRFQALLNTIQDIAGIMIVVLILFLFAAIIETFWSSNAGINVNAKYFFGACSWLALIYYLLFIGKTSEIK